MLSIIVYQLGLSKLISVIAVRYVVPSSLIDDQLFYRPFCLRTRFSIFVSFRKGTQKYSCFLQKIFHNSTSDSLMSSALSERKRRLREILCNFMLPLIPISQLALHTFGKEFSTPRKMCTEREKVQRSRIASSESSPHLYALTCYMRLHSGNFFLLSLFRLLLLLLSFTRARKRNPNPCSVEGKKEKK